MDDLPVMHPGPLVFRNQKITLDLYLKLLLLLDNVKHNQSLMQHCPLRTAVGGFPNLTSEAGSPFFFELPTPETREQKQHYQLSLADGGGALPHWMVFRQQTSSLAGLALTEDCGIYHLRVTVIGEQCAAYFHLHILNGTGNDKYSARDILSCSEREMTVWANPLLQLNPATLTASQRIHLISTMAGYLHLPLGFVYLLSRRNSFIQQQERVRVCWEGAKTINSEKHDVSGHVAQLLWPVGCQGEERLSEIAKVLEYSVAAGELASLLEAPVLGWRVLCGPGGGQHKVKRALQRLKFTPTRNRIAPSPTQVNHAVKLEHSDVYSLPFIELEPSVSDLLVHMNHEEARLEPENTEDSTENTIIKDVLLQFSGTKANSGPHSAQKALKFTLQMNSARVLMYHSDINPGMPNAILDKKTNHMQETQEPSESLFSLKKTTLYSYSKYISPLLEGRIFMSKSTLAAMHTSVCVGSHCSHTNWFSVDSPQECPKETWLTASTVKPLTEVTGCTQPVSEFTSDAPLGISEYFWTTELFHLTFLPAHVSTVETSADTTLSLLPSTTLPSVYSSLLLTPVSYSVAATLTHEAVVRKSLTTSLTLRPHPKETPLLTGSYRASHTDSESQPTVSSLGHFIYNQGPIKDHHTAKPTLYNLPSVSNQHLTESNNDILLLSSRLKTILSPPANKIQTTQLFPDVSPTPYLMTKQLSISQRSDTIQHLSSVLNQDVMSQLNGTTQGASSTTFGGQLALSGQTELEPSLSMPLIEPSVTMSTPALLSEHGQQGTPNIINPEFVVDTLKTSSVVMPLLETSSKSLLPDIGISFLQNNLESPLIKDLEKALMQTSDFLMSLQPTYWASHSHYITSVSLSMLKDQPLKESLKSAQDSAQSISSVQPTIHTLLLPLQSDAFFYMSLLTGLPTSMYLNTELSTIAPSSVSVSIFENTEQVPEDHFDPTAPSTVQDPYTTAFIYQIHSLDPSFPLCGQSVVQDGSGFNPLIQSTTMKDLLDFLTSCLQDEKHFSAFQSQFESSRQYLSTKTSNPTTHLSPNAAKEINYITTTPQIDISDTLVGSGVSILKSLLISQTHSSGSIPEGCPRQKTVSTSLSPFFGMSTTSLTSSQTVSSSRRQTSVQPTPPSASISSFMNLPPKVMQSIPMLTATVGFPFHYSIPPKTFLDPEDGEADTLSLEIRLIDGPPLSIGTWLALDGLVLHGVPLEVDLQFAPQDLLLSARDRQGLSTWLPLTLDLHRSPVNPCHIFTLTVQRSLHSILRHRYRVELMLRKLSHFFNSSTNHHLSVVSMRPGSTVVSWYNYSLCGMSHNRVRHCHVSQIQSMWLAMRSVDGSVNPVFKEAMLPQFPISKVGSVSYRQDCFSTTTTPIFDGSPPAAHTTTNTSLSLTSTTPPITNNVQQNNLYQWMAGTFTALLVVCVLILILLLVAAVLYFCKGSGRSRAFAIWPAGNVLSVQSRDQRAVRPRRPPLFQPELPPPPLRLWINLSQSDEEALQPRPPQYDFI